MAGPHSGQAEWLRGPSIQRILTRQTPTGLSGYLRERGLTRIYLVGLATDFCIAYSALDARRLGFEVTVIEAGCRGIDIGGSLESAWRQMEEAGVNRA